MHWHNGMAMHETIGCIAEEPLATFEQASLSLMLERRLGSNGKNGTRNPVHLPNPYPTYLCLNANPDFWCRLFQLIW